MGTRLLGDVRGAGGVTPRFKILACAGGLGLPICMRFTTSFGLLAMDIAG